MIPIPEGATVIKIPDSIYNINDFYHPVQIRGNSLSENYESKGVTGYDSKCVLKFGVSVYKPHESYVRGEMSTDTLKIQLYQQYFKRGTPEESVDMRFLVTVQ